MIIWLASYPKSGNTWVRHISSLIYSNQGKWLWIEIKIYKTISIKRDILKNLLMILIISELKKYWIKAQNKINSNGN